MRILFLIAFISLAATATSSSYAQEEVELEATSEQGTFLIVLSWMQNDLGEENTFQIRFIEPETGSELEDIQYDFSIVRTDTGEQIVRRVDQVSTEQKASFEEVGSHTVRIEDIEGLGEDAAISIQVTPEFPIGVVIPVMVITLVVIIAVRYRANSLFS